MKDFVIDPTFSIYQLVERRQTEGILLNRRETMSRISHVIEGHVLDQPADMQVYAGFQYLSRFLPQMKRYRKMAQSAKHIYVFGVPDILPPAIDNLTYIELKPEDALAKEWFILAYGKDYQCALATEELTSFHDPDEERVFKGVWTFDTRIINILNEWLAREMGLRVLEDSEYLIPPQVEQQIKVEASEIVARQIETIRQPVVRQEMHIHLNTSLR